MKTAEEFYKEISESKALQEELQQAADLEAFLQQHDCAADAKEFAAFVRAQAEGELDDDAAAAAAGGGWKALDYHIPTTVIPHAPV